MLYSTRYSLNGMNKEIRTLLCLKDNQSMPVTALPLDLYISFIAKQQLKCKQDSVIVESPN